MLGADTTAWSPAGDTDVMGLENMMVCDVCKDFAGSAEVGPNLLMCGDSTDTGCCP